MGFPFSWANRSSGRGATKKLLMRRSAKAAIESLERRILFDVQVNTSMFDAPGNTGKPSTDAANQAETTNVTFSPPGSSADQVVVAYNDGAMAQFGQVNGQVMHRGNWSFSSDGGNTFNQPSDYPYPALLPTVPNGSVTTGDDANHSLAWDNANGKLYLASTSWPNHSDINVYTSTDAGQTFPNGTDATPGAPTEGITYDKPWLAVDNYLGAGYGTVYLAYVEIGQSSQIQITSLGPTASSWPQPFNPGQAPGYTVPTSTADGPLQDVQSPEVLVEPNHTVDVVFVGYDSTAGKYGIYFYHSGAPTYAQGWSATQSPVLLATFQSINSHLYYEQLSATIGGSSTGTTIQQVLVYPSVAIGTIKGGDTYLYAAYTDGNLDTNGNPTGTVGVYELQYDLTTGKPVGNGASQIGMVSGIFDEWMPAMTLSPDGSYAFIGFYGGNGVYDSIKQTFDEQYNMFYVAGHTDANGIIWSAGSQLTHLGGSGQPDGGYFDQPGGPSTDTGSDPAPAWTPDYDSASADWQGFHYSFMETSNENLFVQTDPEGDGYYVDVPDQEDIYMANVAIPYSGTAPATPYGVTFTPDGSGGTVNWITSPYSRLTSAYAHIEYSTDTQGWVELTDPNNPPSASAGSAGYTVTIPNYSPGMTYYLRVRIQNRPTNPGDPDASSGYSDPVQSWTAGAPSLDNAMYAIWGYDGSDTQYRMTVAWPLGMYDSTDTVYVQYYDPGSGSWTTLSDAPGDAGWAEGYILLPSSDPLPAYNFRIYVQNASGGQSPYSNVLTAIDASSSNVPAAPSIEQPISSDPSNPTVESGEVDVSWNGGIYSESEVMDVVLTPINDYGDYGVSAQTYAAYGDAFVDGIEAGVEYAIQIRVENPYEGQMLTSDFSSPVYIVGI